MQIRTYQTQDEAALIALWSICGLLEKSWQSAQESIALKIAFQPDLLLVGEKDGHLIASVMAGYDGHRGWLNYLSVHPDYRQQGLARQIVQEAERRLALLGCPKVNLQVRNSNIAVTAFYEKIGYGQDNVFGMGKRLPGKY